MKKLIFLLLCTATLGLVSCKKDTIVQNILPRTIIYDIPASGWKTSDGGYTYSTTIKVPENNEDFNQAGGVIVSLSFDSQKRVYDGLPNVVAGLSYNFAYEPGYVTIFIEDVAGLKIGTPPTGTIRSKIVLVDSEIID
ncbi:hypothetical protein ABIE26_005214 [Pedobacter africanus]|uniref:Uncharacterized protein n=1 Tax=Pedobacter africanus TaxID=151894 RepID=A0ACC6L587_9SPHI|nr:hypothetical protein [Pedobacter africanus]MDR6786600.1 hypothetical protein [Pedobacter africanus]